MRARTGHATLKRFPGHARRRLAGAPLQARPGPARAHGALPRLLFEPGARLGARASRSGRAPRRNARPRAPGHESRLGKLIRKVYEVDPLVCPKCGAQMRVIALIEDPAVIERILSWLGLWHPEGLLIRRSQGRALVGEPHSCSRTCTRATSAVVRIILPRSTGSFCHVRPDHPCSSGSSCPRRPDTFVSHSTRRWRGKGDL